MCMDIRLVEDQNGLEVDFVTPARVSSRFGMGFGWVSLDFSGLDTKVNLVSSKKSGMGFWWVLRGFSVSPTKPDKIDRPIS